MKSKYMIHIRRVLFENHTKILDVYNNALGVNYVQGMPIGVLLSIFISAKQSIEYTYVPTTGILATSDNV